ncbi:MAG: thioredoxin-dependent thiol peroxidase [Bacteroidetes bacterium]|nr:MAG: thioredoxin-dependent thiol peroxidase [Bacteroidota bacterium]
MAFLAPGSPAPEIPLNDQDGVPVSLSEYRGKKVVVFFYAEDNSGTCTKEACNLRDNYDVLRAKGFEVLGVSPDDEKSHRKFIAKQTLNYRLIADPEHKWIQAFGVWGEKQMYGRSYMGLLRTTFLIDENGIVTHVIEKVKSAEHAAQILELA